MDLSMDLSNVQEMQENSPIPPGEYNIKIIGSEYKESRSGNGGYLRMQYKVMDGAFAGRSVFDNLNLWHSEQKTREISQSRLKAIAKAIRHPNPSFIRNTDEFIGHQMSIRVSVKDDFNNVKAYKESTIQPSVPQSQPQMPPTGMSPQTPPPPPQVTPAPNGAATPWG